MTELNSDKDLPVMVAFCKFCYAIVLREKMSDHWAAIHKDVKAANYL
jgi:hypothetical protein